MAEELHFWNEAGATNNEKHLRAYIAGTAKAIADNHETFRKSVDSQLVQIGQHMQATRERFDKQEQVLSDLATAVSGQDALMTKLTTTLESSLHVDATFLRKLNEFFGPMLEGKNPPLDGNQIATKDYVDKAVERIAAAIRQQIAQAIELTNEMVKRLGVTRTVGGVIDAISRVVQREHEREVAEEAARNQPDRLKSLYYALTGRTPR